MRVVRGVNVGGMSTSLTVRCDDANAVVDATRSLSRRCFVGPVEDGWVGVFDEACDQDERECVHFGKALTKCLGCDALAAMVHDGDTFACWTFSRGRLLDTYESWPAYFDGGPPAPRGGKPALLCKIASAPAAELAVRRIFLRGVATKRKRAPSLHDGMALHGGLWSALGLPLSTVGLGYKYLAWGDRPKAVDGRSELDVVHVDGGGGDDSGRRRTHSKEAAALVPRCSSRASIPPRLASTSRP